MGYHIVYQWDKEKSFKKYRSKMFWVVIGVMAFAAALGYRLRYPDGGYLEDLFLPFTDEFVSDSFINMIHQLEQGVPLGDAVTVFCTEVLSNGN